MKQGRSPSKLDFLAIILLLILFGAFYLYHLTWNSYGSVEPESFILGRIPFINYLTNGGGWSQAPLFFKLLQVWTHFLGFQKEATRLLPYSLALLCVPVFYLFLRTTANTWIAILLSLLFFSNRYWIEQVQLIRPNSLYFFGVLLSTFYFYKFLTVRGKKSLNFFFIFSSLTLLTHYTFLPFFVLQLIFIIFSRRDIKINPWHFGACAIAATVPIYVKAQHLFDFLFHFDHVKISIWPKWRWFLELYFPNYDLNLALNIVIGLFFAIVVLKFLVRKGANQFQRFSAISICLSLALYLTWTFMKHSHIHPRYFYFTVPVFFYLFAETIKTTTSKLGSLVLISFISILIVLNFKSSFNFLNERSLGDFEGAAKYYLEHRTKDSWICANDPHLSMAEFLAEVVRAVGGVEQDFFHCDEINLKPHGQVFRVVRALPQDMMPNPLKVEPIEVINYSGTREPFTMYRYVW